MHKVTASWPMYLASDIQHVNQAVESTLIWPTVYNKAMKPNMPLHSYHITTPKPRSISNPKRGPYTQNPRNAPGTEQASPRLETPSEISEDDQEPRIQNIPITRNLRATEDKKSPVQCSEDDQPSSKLSMTANTQVTGVAPEKRTKSQQTQRNNKEPRESVEIRK